MIKCGWMESSTDKEVFVCVIIIYVTDQELVNLALVFKNKDSKAKTPKQLMFLWLMCIPNYG